MSNVEEAEKLCVRTCVCAGVWLCEVTVNNNWLLRVFHPGWQARRWGQPVNMRDGSHTSAVVSERAQPHPQPCQGLRQPQGLLLECREEGRVG